MANTLTAREVLELLRREVLREEGIEGAESVQSDAGDVMFSVRYFGGGWGWEVPEDADDDGDYDWKVPTADTRRKADALVAKYRAAYGLPVEWHNEGEKCWIAFVIPAAK